MARKTQLWINLEDGTAIGLTEARKMFKQGDMEIGLLLRDLLKDHPDYRQLTNTEKQKLKNYTLTKQARLKKQQREEEQKAMQFENIIADGNSRATPIWIRDLIERYAAGDQQAFTTLSSTPFGEVLLQTFGKAAQGDLRASDQVFKMLGVYNAVVVNDSKDNDKKPEIFSLPE